MENTNTQMLTRDHTDVAREGKYLSFEIDRERYGISIQNVIDIIGVQDITAVPGQPDYVQGVINLRGQIIPTMDVRIRFQKKPLDYSDRTCIVVVDLKGVSVGIIVDKVLEVQNIDSEVISPPPQAGELVRNSYISGISKLDDTVIMLLDCKRLLKDDVNEEYWSAE